jgi:hypothetical protein
MDSPGEISSWGVRSIVMVFESSETTGIGAKAAARIVLIRSLGRIGGHYSNTRPGVGNNRASIMKEDARMGPEARIE